ncbi:hypothetical protein [uncultured Brevundimonas sp.]|uniref:hypothetical protein n=1 Tax=uncultured Brevundimonas sp. TaxID=213418 RepID=UPI0025CD3320|nr:hypothetical protein [uncultured Brevundimonas sp.]
MEMFDEIKGRGVPVAWVMDFRWTVRTTWAPKGKRPKVLSRKTYGLILAQLDWQIAGELVRQFPDYLLPVDDPRDLPTLVGTAWAVHFGG